MLATGCLAMKPGHVNQDNGNNNIFERCMWRAFRGQH